MEENKNQRQIKLLKILAKGCKKHPGYRAIRKATERCEECVIIWQAKVELSALEKKITNSIESIQAYNETLTQENTDKVQGYSNELKEDKLDTVQAYNETFTQENTNTAHVYNSKNSFNSIKNDRHSDNVITYSPLIVFSWSSVFYSLASYTIDIEGFWFVLGVICLGLGFFSSKYLNGITLQINASLIYLIGFIGIFVSMLLVNNIDIIQNNLYLNHLILGMGFSCFILSSVRFFYQMINN